LGKKYIEAFIISRYWGKNTSRLSSFLDVEKGRKVHPFAKSYIQNCENIAILTSLHEEDLGAQPPDPPWPLSFAWDHGCCAVRPTHNTTTTSPPQLPPSG
jgi:hypothetical protein